MRNTIFGVVFLVVTGLSVISVWSQGAAPAAPAAPAAQPLPKLPAPPAVPPGPIGPSPYQAVDGWLKPFDKGFTFGGNVGVFPESPNRIFIIQRGSTRLPSVLPPEFDGFAYSIGLSTQAGDGREWRNIIVVVDGNGRMIETWSQWDHLFARTDTQPGPHRIRISPYDPEKRVWAIDESAHQIHVFSNDGKKHLMSLGEKNVSGSDSKHFGRPQDVAFFPDGRVLVADGLLNARVVIFDAKGTYLTEFGTKGDGQGLFRSAHGIATGPDGLIFLVDRDGREVEVFRDSKQATGSYHPTITPVAVWGGFETPLDAVVNGDNTVWISDLGKPKVVKFDMKGTRLYTWFWPTEGADRFREMHTMIADSAGNLYGSDNQLGRTLKLVPKPGADPNLLIKQK